MIPDPPFTERQGALNGVVPASEHLAANVRRLYPRLPPDDSHSQPSNTMYLNPVLNESLPPSLPGDRSARSFPWLGLSIALAAGLVLLLISLLCPGEAAAQAPTQSLADYEYSPDKGPRDRVVHYLKSNLDGSNRLVLSVHFSEPLKLEVLKVERDGRALALVVAELDSATLTEARMQSFNALEAGAPRLQMMLKSEPGSRRLVAHVAKAEMPVAVSHLPAHIYNFDLMGFNATLPFLKDPRRDFEVGIVDPDFTFLAKHFKPDGGVQEGGFIYKGKATIRYVGEDKVNDVPCFKYEVAGPAFNGVKGTLWINAQDQLLERFEHALPDNPDWNSLRLVRLGTRVMDAAGWREFKDATVKRAMLLRGGG